MSCKENYDVLYKRTRPVVSYELVILADMNDAKNKILYIVQNVVELLED
jgi:hypothetical protein